MSLANQFKVRINSLKQFFDILISHSKVKHFYLNLFLLWWFLFLLHRIITIICIAEASTGIHSIRFRLIDWSTQYWNTVQNSRRYQQNWILSLSVKLILFRRSLKAYLCLRRKQTKASSIEYTHIRASLNCWHTIDQVQFNRDYILFYFFIDTIYDFFCIEQI